MIVAAPITPPTTKPKPPVGNGNGNGNGKPTLQQMIASAKVCADLLSGNLSDAIAEFGRPDCVPDCSLPYKGMLPLHALAKSTNPKFDWNDHKTPIPEQTKSVAEGLKTIYRKIVDAGPRSALTARTQDGDGYTAFHVRWFVFFACCFRCRPN
jgi:hypothetical protein